MTFLEAVLPGNANNTYKGSPIALWIFAAFTVISFIRSLIHMLKNDGGAQSIATIPLDKYPKKASETIVFIFGYWGISQLLMCFVYAAIIWKYQNLLPLGWILFTFEYGLRLVQKMYKTIETVGQAPGGILNHFGPLIGIFMFWLSLPSL